LVGYLYGVVLSKVVNRKNDAVRQEKTFQPHNSRNEQSKAHSSNHLCIFDFPVVVPGSIVNY